MEKRRKAIKLGNALRTAKLKGHSQDEIKSLEIEFDMAKKGLANLMVRKYGSRLTPSGWARGTTKEYEQQRTSRALVLELRRMRRILKKPAVERHPFAWKLRKIADTINEALELKW